MGLCSDGCLLFLILCNFFNLRVECLLCFNCYIYSKNISRTQPLSGHIPLIIQPLKQSRCIFVLGIACCRDVIWHTNSTCVQLCIISIVLSFLNIIVCLSHDISVARFRSDTIPTWNCDQVWSVHRFRFNCLVSPSR